MKLKSHIKRRLISRIFNFLKKCIERFQIIRLFVKVDQNVYKTAIKSASIHTNQILLSRNRPELSPRSFTHVFKLIKGEIFTSNIKHYNNIKRNSIFNYFWNNTGVLFSLEEGWFFFYLETERFLPIIREKFRKLSEIDGFPYRREFKQFCPLLRRCREPKEMSALDKCFWGYGYAWNSLSHYDDDATISHNNENHNSLWALHLGNIERSHARVTSERRGGSKVQEKSESSSFPPPLTASPLTCAFACNSKWRGCYQSITFLGSPASSLFDEPVYVSNSDEKFKQRPLWLHVSFFTHFNQPLTINNIAALTHAWHKKSSHRRDTPTHKCSLW